MQEIQKREKFKYIEAGGRRWKVCKLDATTAAYIGYKVLMQALPMGLEGMLGLPKMEKRQGLTLMNKQEFRELVMDCLNACYEIKEAGGQELPVRAVTDTGAYGVEGLDDDLGLLVLLLFNVLSFNLAGFFGGKGLSLTDMLSPSDTNPADAKT